MLDLLKNKEFVVKVKNAHRALGDCVMTLKVIESVWAKETQGVE